MTNGQPVDLRAQMRLCLLIQLLALLVYPLRRVRCAYSQAMFDCCGTLILST